MALTFIACLAGGADSVCAAGGAAISVERQQGRDFVIVHNVPAEVLAQRPRGPREWAQLFRVAVDREGAVYLPAISGDYTVEGGALVFTPRHALRPGVAYRATFRGGDAPAVEYRFNLPNGPRAKPTSVRAVYPSADQLPENLLKFYIHFSAPMRQAVAYEHVRVLRGDGTPLADPFVDVGQELWDPTGTRLTLIFDPGRIKHGVRPHEEMGPVLEAGKAYTLEIDKAWKDAAGRPLNAKFNKKFQVVAPDVDPPDPQQWRIVPPNAGAAKPIKIEFPEPMDYALAQNSIQIVGPSGQPLEGAVSLSRDERLWKFTPSTAWQAGRYTIVVDGRLEDLAAHSVGRPFEVKINSDAATPAAIESVSLRFLVE